jgi:TPR repeat protein
MIKEQVVPGKQGERAGLHLRACAQGDDIACNWLAEATLTLDAWNAPRDRDYTQARQLIEADCASGNDYTCRKLVRYVSHEDAEKYLAKCETGQTLFCALVAGGDFYPFHDTSQAPRVEETWRGLCESGEGMACIFLADLISSGHGRDVFETQRAHMERACDLGIAHGCNVARDYMLVEVPDADRATRMRYLQPSCEAGYARACQLIARLKRLDDDSSFIHYAEVLHLDCLAGGWRSCEAAAPVFHELRFKLNLSERYEDVDQYIQNYFDLAAALKRSLPVVFR